MILYLKSLIEKLFIENTTVMEHLKIKGNMPLTKAAVRT
jgi:hypothetical protein